MTRRVLHMHVGLPKCGSSSLQAFFLDNQVALNEAGFWYPPLVSKKIGNATPFVMAHEPPGKFLENFVVNNPGFEAEQAKQDFFAALKNSEHDRIIISAEWLQSFLMTHGVDQVVDGFDDIVAHIFCRPRDSWLLSFYTQLIKTGKYTFTFEEFLASPYFEGEVSRMVRFADVFEFWKKHSNEITMLPYFIGGSKDGAIEQFLAGLDLTLERFTLSTTPVNMSPSPFECCVLASFERKDFPDFVTKHSAARFIARKHDVFDKSSLLSRASSEFITSYFAEDTERLREITLPFDPAVLDSGFDPALTAITFDEIRQSESFAAVTQELRDHGIEMR